MSSLPFFAADTLGMTLYEKQGEFRAEEARIIHFGPWKVELKIEVESDLINTKECTFWVRFSPTLWMYFVIREKENWIFAIDCKKLALTKKTLKKYTVGETAKEMVNGLQVGIAGVFRWKHEEWKELDVEDWQKI